MDVLKAADAFSALSQPSRLDAYRLLIKVGKVGVPAGEIASRLGVRQNTMSANLAVLLRAGLIRRQREGRVIRYFADLEAMQDLLAYMLQECCGGRPDLCAPVIEEITCG